ncbi:MerR family transcriptional regulator [Umezawaea tangerina]|uniref:DNA-binding transcriptional MerR regulator n=1 Tax=Umezawaea tangerina TaxID=84725 RepID=A0A2T0SX69_9PSEU|nr:MerR family transcriptional regulator [Umezawaea tangerina]PRY38024.1 DNA-binding transcriptional MerR regulator [Umezawaea tangerina]
MRIGDLAGKTGVAVRSLRYYEEQGLLTSVRGCGGQRQYDESAVERVDLIQLLYSAGLSSKAIRGLLPCVVSKASTPESRTALAAERERIDGQIADLVRARDKLDEIILFSGSPESGCTWVETAQV